MVFINQSGRRSRPAWLFVAKGGEESFMESENAAAGVWDQIRTVATQMGWKILGALVVLVIGIVLIRVIKKLIYRGKGYQKLNPGAQNIVRNIVNVVLITLMVLTIAGILGIPLSTFITVLASAGVAVSLALQGVLGNLIAGLLINITKPFTVGDYISTGPFEGKVKEIDVFNTVLVSFPGNTKVIVPNSSLTNVAITNFTALGVRRAPIDFEVKAGADIAMVDDMLKKTAAGIDTILKDPAPDAFLSRIENGKQIFTAVVWTTSADYIAGTTAMTEIAEQTLKDRDLVPVASIVQLDNPS